MHSEAVKDWLQTAVARFPNTALLDMNAHICPDGLCHAELDGHVVYRDDQHLTGSFAESLAGAMTDRLFSDTPDADSGK